MDPGGNAASDDRGQSRGIPSQEYVLPSRAAALAAIRAAIESQADPILVTGESGVGKTWLWRRVAGELPAGWRCLGIDVTPSTTPADLFHAIHYRLGLDGPVPRIGTRLVLEDFLQERTSDGERWVLVVDEAHTASALVLEEVRILANRLGRSDGLAAVLLVGQSPLARRLATRPLSSFESRLAARVHLQSLDIEEARDLLDRLAPAGASEDAQLERQHRDTGGNPKRLLQWVRREAPRAPFRIDRIRPDADPAPDTSDSSPPRVPAARAPMRAEPPLFGASPPPLQVAEGIVEVGWEPTPAAVAVPDLVADPPLPDPVSTGGARPEPSEEAIADHYAALQAWNEWAQNQGRQPATRPPDPAESDHPDVVPAEDGMPEDGGDPVTGKLNHTTIWAEGQQGFAPYSQLFSRMRQARDST
jgi:general secretion pathway protein A